MYNIVPVLNIYTLYCSLTVLKQTQPLVISVSYKKPVRMVLHSTQLTTLFTLHQMLFFHKIVKQTKLH